MAKPLSILFVASEIYPIAKTGGVADVAYGLPLALRDLDHDVPVARAVQRQRHAGLPKRSITVWPATTRCPTATATATWTIPVQKEGLYPVFAWFRASSNRTTAARYTIHHTGGTSTAAPLGPTTTNAPTGTDFAPLLLQPGDLLGTGTISGPTPAEAGAMVELSRGGTQAITLAGTGETRTFLQDGDTVVLRGWCEKPGAARVGFGECRGQVLPAKTS